MNDSAPSPQYAPAPPTNRLAVISLVSGILSWFLFPVIGALVAIVTGHMARREIKNSFGTQSGDGLAIAGLIIGYINLVLSCVSLLVVVLIFGGAFGLGACALLSESAGLVISSDTLASFLPN
jgi:hypothetical protein